MLAVPLLPRQVATPAARINSGHMVLFAPSLYGSQSLSLESMIYRDHVKTRQKQGKKGLPADM